MNVPQSFALIHISREKNYFLWFKKELKDLKKGVSSQWEAQLLLGNSCAPPRAGQHVLPGIRVNCLTRGPACLWVLTGKCLCRSSPGSSASQGLGLYCRRSTWHLSPLLDLLAGTVPVLHTFSNIHSSARCSSGLTTLSCVMLSLSFRILKFWHLGLSLILEGLPSHS